MLSKHRVGVEMVHAANLPLFGPAREAFPLFHSVLLADAAAKSG